MSIILQAHRGMASDYPENTLTAMRAAVRLGYGVIELDTKFTSDDHCVILHDRTLDRTARYKNGGSLPAGTTVDSMMLQDLRQLDFGAWFGAEFAGERIPTLEEALALAKESGVPLKLDNVLWSHTEEQREIMFGLIEQADALSVVGFTESTVEQVRELLKRFPQAYVHYDGTPDEDSLRELSRLVPRDRLTVWLRYHNRHTAWCNTPPATAELAERVQPVGRIGMWLLTGAEELADAERMGAELVETDGTLKPGR